VPPGKPGAPTRPLTRAAGSTRDSKEISSFLQKASQFAAKIPDDAGFQWFLQERGHAGPDERQFLDYIFTGSAAGWVDRAKFLSAVHQTLVVSKTSAIATGYAQAQVNVGALPLVKVLGSGATIFSGKRSPGRVPLMRVQGEAELVWLNRNQLTLDKAGGRFCRILVYRDASPLFGWVSCNENGIAQDQPQHETPATEGTSTALLEKP
jgi:hypothetical protein